jgi:hypothetical protein
VRLIPPVHRKKATWGPVPASVRIPRESGFILLGSNAEVCVQHTHERGYRELR